MQVFETFDKLRRHLNDHVLTPPESHAWGVVWRGQFDCLKDTVAASDECYRLREVGWKAIEPGLTRDTAESQATTGQGSPATPAGDAAWFRLSVAYQDEIRKSLGRSQRLNWSKSRGEYSIHFDTCGIVLVCRWQGSKGSIKTAFIPGFSTRAATVRSKREWENPHSRVSPSSLMRGDASSGTRARSQDNHLTIRERLAQQHAAKWDAEERLFYLVFRPAVQAVRSRQAPGIESFARGSADTDAGEALGFSSGVDMRLTIGDLKAVLPKQSELKMESWKRLMAEAEGHSAAGQTTTQFWKDPNEQPA